MFLAVERLIRLSPDRERPMQFLHLRKSDRSSLAEKKLLSSAVAEREVNDGVRQQLWHGNHLESETLEVK
jgi:hypothetical protein